MGVTLPGAAGEVKESYEISNSLRFNRGDSPYLNRTPSSAGNRQTWTTSFWIKRTTLGTSQHIFSTYTGTASINTQCDFRTDNKFQFYDSPGTGSYNWYYLTNRVFTDVSAWYHFVLAVDTTQSSASDRVKIYVNGVQETSFSSSTNPSENNNTADWNNNSEHRIGRHSSNYLDGYLTEFHNVDGSQLLPTSFGEFDDNGVWVPKRYIGSYGTNGFFLQFKQTGTSQNSSGIGADTSGNDHHWAVNNLAATDITEDTCTNNFATLNSALADGQFNSDQLSEGNTFYNEGQGNNGAGQPTATFAFNSGKWYWEVQVPSQQNSRAIGFCRMDRVGIDQPPQLHGNGFTATNSVVGIDLTDDTIDQVDNAGSHTQHVGSLTGMSDNDIFGVAVNLDDGNFQFYRNGSTYGSSYSLSNLSEWQEHGAVPCASGKSYQAYRFNFGNPAFSISSGNNDGKYGNFEYAPPSGYYALCTKRLAEFG
jgi:hypothetical protein